VRLEDVDGRLETAKERAPLVDPHGHEPPLLPLPRNEPRVGIDLTLLQPTERSPRRAVGKPDELVPGADAEDRHRRNADCLQQPRQRRDLVRRPIGGAAADHYRRRRELRDLGRGNVGKAHANARPAGRCREAGLRLPDLGAVGRAALGIVEHQVVLGVDIQDGHRHRSSRSLGLLRAGSARKSTAPCYATVGGPRDQ
jgi:hypothetical protein